MKYEFRFNCVGLKDDVIAASFEVPGNYTGGGRSRFRQLSKRGFQGGRPVGWRQSVNYSAFTI
jgi:hypothetical protein